MPNTTFPSIDLAQLADVSGGCKRKCKKCPPPAPAPEQQQSSFSFSAQAQMTSIAAPAPQPAPSSPSVDGSVRYA